LGVLDKLRVIFIRTVLIISLAVIAFRHSYIWASKSILEFYRAVLCFVSSMVLLIRRPNLLRLIIGWDGLGISSYFLVIFYRRNKSLNAGLLTAISNRVGDGLILIALVGGFSAPGITYVELSRRGASLPPL